MTIPPCIHFCWIGTHLPWAYVFAILSAAERSGLPEVILHHTEPLEDGAELRALADAHGVTMHRIDPIAYLMETGDELGLGDRLAAVYTALDSPPMQADILRAAILFRRGGIYLDLDTITVSPLLPLLDASQFVGCEYVVWPRFVRESRSAGWWARSLALDLARRAMCRMTNGWETFRRIERLYYRTVNNAVMGAEPKSRLFARYLRAMLDVAPERLRQPYALGPDLLQEVIDRDRQDDLIVHDPKVFYPLPPEISEHWFRTGDEVRLDAVLSAETRVVHWYASIRTKSRVALITPTYVREHQNHQLYSALVCSTISKLPEAV